MKTAYKIILTAEEDGYFVTIPDFECNTQGKDIADAMYMARDAIGLMGITLEDMGKEIPKPDTDSYESKDGDMELYVDIDFVEYRKGAKKYGTKQVKKITIVDESFFCPADELYKEKLVITETGIKYRYEPLFLDCNQPRSWSYKTTSEAFKVVFNQIFKRSYDMMKYTDEVYLTDVIPTKITVTYEDGHKEKNEMYWFRKEFGDVCELLRGLVPPFADIPVFLDDRFEYEEEDDRSEFDRWTTDGIGVELVRPKKD